MKIKLAVGFIAVVALAFSAGAATLTDNGQTPPSVNVLVSQLSEMTPLGGGWGGGTLDPGRDYMDNGGPPGQTFTLNTAPYPAAKITALTFKGGMDAGEGFSPWAQGVGFTNRSFQIQFGTVNPVTGAITQLAMESTPPFTSDAINTSNFFTLTLDTPLILAAGANYSWSLKLDSLNWFGISHSATDVYAGGYAFNNNGTTNSTDWNAYTKYTFNGYAAPRGASATYGSGNYGNFPDYVFVLQGEGFIPEPSTVALVGLAAGGLLVLRRRKS